MPFRLVLSEVEVAVAQPSKGLGTLEGLITPLVHSPPKPGRQNRNCVSYNGAPGYPRLHQREKNLSQPLLYHQGLPGQREPGLGLVRLKLRILWKAGMVGS